MKKFDVLVIGGGPGGITVTRNLGRRKDISVGVIRPEDHSMIYCAIPYVIEGLISIEKTFKSDGLVTDVGAELIRDKAVKVDFDNKQVAVEKGDIYGYDKLVIATGSEPAFPNIPGISLSGVFAVKTENDLKITIELKEKGLKKAVVVGAGAIGVELAQALRGVGVSVDLIDIADQILRSMADGDMTAEVQGRIIDNGIRMFLNTQVTQLKGDKTVQEVVLNNGEVIKFAGKEGEPVKGAVFFAITMKPVIDIFRETALDIEKGGIVVNGRMETNIPNIYAVGDCVQFVSGITGAVISGKLATNAVPMGKVAARNIMGIDSEYRGYFNGAATKVYDLFIGGTGLTEKMALQSGYDVIAGYGATTTIFPILPGAKKVKVKLIADRKTHRLLGGQILSEEPVGAKIDLLTFALQKETLLEELSMLSYSAQPYQSFYPAQNAVVMAADEILAALK